MRFASARSARSAASGVVTALMPGLLALLVSDPIKQLAYRRLPPYSYWRRPPLHPSSTKEAGNASPTTNKPHDQSERNVAGSKSGTRRSAALAIILLAQLMVVLDATIVNIALPKIQTALSFSRTDLSWVLNAYSLTFGGLLLLGARSGDLFGRRRVFLAGIALFTVASLAGGFTTSSGLLLLSRSIQGVGAAFASPSALALLMVTFREGAERTRAIALYTAVSIGGSAVGLVAGGVLVEWVSWRWVFFVNVPVGIVLLVMARRDLPETDRHAGRVDIPGALTSTIGMAALVYGFVQAAAAGWQAGSTIAAFTVGVVLLATFVLIETRVATPITPLRLFADRDRVFSYLARLVLVGGMFGMFFFLTQFLQDVLGYSPLRQRSRVRASDHRLVRRITTSRAGAARARWSEAVDGRRIDDLDDRVARAHPVVGDEQLRADLARIAALRHG